MALEWRNTQREGYIKIGRDKYVKKDDLDYFTEIDLIKRYSAKRGLNEEDVAEFYNLLIAYIKESLDNHATDEEKGYYIRFLGVFIKKNISAKDLIAEKDTVKFKRAKSQLDLYMKTGKHFRIC